MAIIKNPLILISSGGGSADLDGIVDGTITTFTMPSGKTSIYKNRFNGMTSLTSADITGCTSVGNYAFDGCTGLSTVTNGGSVTTIGDYAFQNCSNLSVFPFSNVQTIGTYAFAGCSKLPNQTAASAGALPSTITSIGEGAFASIQKGFDFHPTNPCTIGQNAFYNSAFNRLEGELTVGNYGFNLCKYIVKVDAKLTGALGNYAFGQAAMNTNMVFEKFDISRSTLTSIGSGAFCGFGSTKYNASSRIIDFDFRNCTFTYTNDRLFGDSSASNSYFRAFFPNTVTSLGNQTLMSCQNCWFYFTTPNPPSLSTSATASSGILRNSSNYKIFVPYNSINTYKTATNWTSVSGSIYGWADANTFSDNDTLPTFDANGYALTWYSDIGLSNQVTTVSDATQIYYCSVGTTKVANKIFDVIEINGTLTISDGVNTYRKGDFVPTNTTLTLTVTPDTGYSAYEYTLNGTSFTSGSTYTMSEPITINAVCWDGSNVPYSSTLANNTWGMIKSACKAGLASTLWSVGDTKTTYTSDGDVYTIRLTDLQTGRYAYASDNTPTHAVFETVATLKTNDVGLSGYPNYNSWLNYSTYVSTNEEKFTEIASVLENVNITILNATSGTATTTATVKMFFASLGEVFPSNTTTRYITERISSYDGSAMAGFDYYVATDTNANRIKYNPTGTAVMWCTRTPYNTSYYGNVSTTGTITYGGSPYGTLFFAL